MFPLLSHATKERPVCGMEKCRVTNFVKDLFSKYPKYGRTEFRADECNCTSGCNFRLAVLVCGKSCYTNRLVDEKQKAKRLTMFGKATVTFRDVDRQNSNFSLDFQNCKLERS